jgi:hypothetical protein
VHARALPPHQVSLLLVCAGYQKLDSLAGLDCDDLDRHWQVCGSCLAPALAAVALA